MRSSFTHPGNDWSWLGSSWGSVLASALIVTTVLICAVASAATIAAEPWRQPGTTWSRGFLETDDIRLLASGEFIAVYGCDICELEYEGGTWHNEGGHIVLRAEGSASDKVFVLVQEAGCERLVPEERMADPKSWSFFAYHSDGWCCPECDDRPCPDEL